MQRGEYHAGNAVGVACLALLLAFPGLVRAQTDCINGMAGAFSCENVDLLSHLSLEDLGGIGSAQDNWGWKDSQTGHHYAIVAMALGTSFVDVTDPVKPVYLGKMVSALMDEGAGSDVKTYANHAFVVASRNPSGMQVFDLTRLRGVNSPQIFEPDVFYADIGGAHNVAINEETGYAYLVNGQGFRGCGGDLHIVDIRTPKSPTWVGCYTTVGNRIHDTQCVIYRGASPKVPGGGDMFCQQFP